MNKEEIIEIVDDRMSRRFESLAQSINKLHEEYHDKMLKSVDTQIKVSVNGKIDNIKLILDEQTKTLDSLDKRIKPFEDTTTWFKNAKGGLGWIAGFLTSISLIGFSIMWVIEKIRQ